MEKIFDYLVKNAWGIVFSVGLNKLLIKAPLLRKHVCREELIRSGVKFESASFVECASAGLLPEVKLFTCAGIPVNGPDSEGNTALHAAAGNAYQDVVAHLLSMPKIDVNTKNNAGDTALIVAARLGNTGIITSLLAHKKRRAELLSETGDPARSKAIPRKQRKFAARLRAQPDLDVNARNKALDSALQEAARREYREIVEQLQEAGAKEPELERDAARWQLKRDGKFDESQFVHTAASGELELARKFLRAGMVVNSLNHQEETALIAAVRHRDRDMVELLLAQEGIKFDFQNSEGVRAIDIAAARGYPEIVELLEKAGSHVDQEQVARRRLQEKGLQVRPDVFVAQVAKGDEELVRLFLAAGQHPDAEDDQGNRALIEAAQNGHKRVVELLIDKGANVNLPNRFHVSALEAAERNGHSEISQLLRSRGATPTDPSKESLLDAVEKGNLARIEAALNAGITPDIYTEGGESILIVAVRRENKQMVDLLLQRGAPVDARDRDGKTALMRAAELGLTEIIRSLLGHHADLEATDKDGSTPLMLAIWNGQARAVQLLTTEAKANVNARDERGRSVQMIAAHKGHPAIIELLKQTGVQAESLEVNLLAAAARGAYAEVKTLLKAGANPEVPDQDGNTPLALAAARGWMKVIKALKPGKSMLEGANNQGDTPLMQAARGGQLGVVKFLLGREIKSNINAVNNSGETALLQAAMAGRGAVVEALAQKGANPNLAASETTPLLECCFHGQLGVVKALLEGGADVNQRVEYGFSPLMTAMLAGHAHIEKELRDRNVTLGDLEGQVFLHTLDGNDTGLAKLDLRRIDLNARDRKGWTALMIASREGFDSIAKILLDHNVRTDIRSRDGRTTALLEAASNGRTGILKLLIPRTEADAAVATNALIEAAANGHAEAVRLLVTEAHAAVNGRTKGRVPLIEAAERGHLQVVQALLALGADKQKRSQEGLTATTVAKLHEHEEVVELLAEGGLQEGLRDASLLLAASEGKYGEVERLLSLQTPPDINARDEQGRTPLMRACEAGHLAVVKVLLAHMDVPGRQTAANDRDYRKQTPLMYAVRGGEDQIVKILLGLQANIHAESRDKRTALMEACRLGQFEMVRMLLNPLDVDSRRVVVNHQDDDGNTPLGEALMQEIPYRPEDYAAIIKLLVASGAKLGRDSADFLQAVRTGNAKRVKELIDRVDFKKLRFHGKTPLMLCAENGHDQVARILIDKGADVNNTDSQRVTALMMAVSAKQRKVLRLLLEKGADYDRLDSKESNALIRAAQNEDQEIVKELLAKKPNVDHRDRAGNTALTVAVNKNNPALVGLLLRHEPMPNLDALDKDRRTALTLAHLRGSYNRTPERDLPAIEELSAEGSLKLTEIERLLLKAGARNGWDEAEILHAVQAGDTVYMQDLIQDSVDVNIKDVSGNTPLLIACQKADQKIFELLINKKASANVRNDLDRTPLMEAAKQKNGIEMVKRLYKENPDLDLNAQDKQGETALLEAARAGNQDTVQFLVEKGANVNAANRRGEAPIIELAKYPYNQLIALLLKYGANVCAHDANYDTAIIEAAKYGQLSILQLLLDHLKGRLKADEDKRQAIINAIDRASFTAMDWAKRGEHHPCVQLLRQHGGQSAVESDLIVYTTPSGDHYHRKTCRSIPKKTREDKYKLTERVFREALRLGYVYCVVCKPYFKPTDWTC